MKHSSAIARAAIASFALGCFSAAHSTPSDALAAGKLMAFSHAADALESQCESEATLSGVFAAWRERNRDLLEVIHAYGKRMRWYPANAPDPSRWDRLQTQEREVIAAQMAELLAKGRAEQCHSLADQYESGKFDLRNFHEDLRAIEAYGR
jgi:hypothetical protein